MKKVLSVVLALLLVIGLSACGSSEEPKKVDSQGSEQAESVSESQGPTVFGVGETAELNDVQATLLEVKEKKGSGINKPKDGNIFLVPAFEISNGSKDTLNISSMLSFSVYVDGYSADIDIGAMMDNDLGQLDGEIAPGKKMKGVLGVQAPKDYKEIEIQFTPSAFGDQKIIYKYTK